MTTYSNETPEQVRTILESAMQSRQRLSITYGDRETGKPWGDREESGYIGRSTGTVKIPLLVHNARCYGGPGLLDDCIIQIRTSRGKHVLYQHPEFTA